MWFWRRKKEEKKRKKRWDGAAAYSVIYLTVSFSLRVELVCCVSPHVLMLGIWSAPGMHNTSMYTTFNLFNLNICYVCGSYQCPYCPNFNIATAIKATITLLCLISGFLIQRYYVLRSWYCCAWECVNGFDWDWAEVKDTIIFSSGKSRIVLLCRFRNKQNEWFSQKKVETKGLKPKGWKHPGCSEERNRRKKMWTCLKSKWC